jgi:hypothetical protein
MRAMKRNFNFKISEQSLLALWVVLVTTLFFLPLPGCATGQSSPKSAAPPAIGAVTITNTVTITARLDLAAKTAPVPQSFLGISCEYSDIAVYMSPQDHRQVLTAALLNALGALNGPPVLRIGGNSEDRSVWNLPAVDPAPRFARIDITPTMADDLRDTARLTHSQLILGLNLASDDPQVAAAWVVQALKIFDPDSILAFEIGNEPDEFAKHGIRKQPWNYAAYRADFEKFAKVIAPLLPREHMIAGPAATGFLVSMVARFAADEEQYLGVITVHRYPMGAPVKNPKAANYASMANMLRDSSVATYARVIVPVVAAARKTHARVRFGEMNSAYGGGKPGLSSSFGSALWGLDTLFTVAHSGADGVNFHMGASYAAFTFDYSGDLHVHPLYYGMLLFAQAVQNHARLIPVNFQTAANVKIWAALDPSGMLRLVVINKDLTADAVIHLLLPGAAGPAQITRLTAPLINSQNGLTLGRITYDGSFNGYPVQLPPTLDNMQIAASSDGSYVFNVPHANAAMLTVKLGSEN